MILSRITDGLGNQMFQYANGRARSIDRHTGLSLDTSWYADIEQRFTTREFQLDAFNIEATILSASKASMFKSPQLPIGIRSVYYRFQNILPYYKRKHVKEAYYGFDPNILNIKNNTYLQGFWQSFKYFEEYRHQIIKEFSLKTESLAFLSKCNEIKTENSVSLHVRRGDYCNREQNPQHCLLGHDYYSRAIEKTESKVGKTIFYVFSDDISWARQTFKGEQFRFCDTHFSAPEEMLLMSSCKHNIIANSTFSWWAAWLNTNSHKVVVAPVRWFENEDKNTQDLLPKSWLKI